LKIPIDLRANHARPFSKPFVSAFRGHLLFCPGIFLEFRVSEGQNLVHNKNLWTAEDSIKISGTYQNMQFIATPEHIVKKTRPKKVIWAISGLGLSQVYTHMNIYYAQREFLKNHVQLAN
jgi:hypothetical protein